VRFRLRLSFSNHCSIICAKANARANLILRSFRSRYVDILVKTFVTFVRPLVEYALPMWSTRLARDCAMVKRVQKRFTKRLPDFHRYNYATRLQLLKLESLEARRVNADLVPCYKIVHRYVDIDKNKLFSFVTTEYARGHDLKIVRKHAVVNARAFHFSNLVISH